MAHRNIIAKTTGGIGAFFGLLAVDPFGVVSAIIGLVWAQSGTLFTVTSIAGFTLAPNIPQLPEGTLQAAAILFGGIFVLTLLDKLAEALMDRVRGENQ